MKLGVVQVQLPNGEVVKKRGGSLPTHAIIGRVYETQPVWERTVKETFLGKQEVRVMVGNRRTSKRGEWQVISWHESEDSAHAWLGIHGKDKDLYDQLRIKEARKG